MVLNINKPIGITSYDVIRRLKKIYPKEKIGHAGTLDPLAEGILICLTGKDTRRQSEYLNAVKEYEFEVLFGFKTDTYDVLGISKDFIDYNPLETEKKLRELVPNYIGEIMQSVPRFSAVKVHGTPLYRKSINDPENVEVPPARPVQVNSLEILSVEPTRKDIAFKRILDLVDTVKSGFRQKEIIARWKELSQQINQNELLMVKFKAEVSKGTYVRAIAHDLGQDLGIGACTTIIRRTRVGDFRIEDAQVI